MESKENEGVDRNTCAHNYSIVVSDTLIGDSEEGLTHIKLVKCEYCGKLENVNYKEEYKSR